MCPPLMKLDSIKEYKDYYELHYCKSPLVTSDGIRIFFGKDLFAHAFYESVRGGSKNTFSEKRSERISWIKNTIESEESTLYQGWDKSTQQYIPDRRVAIQYQDFVVVVRLSLNKKGTLKGNFVTCYFADNSIGSIKKSPIWTKEECLNRLNFGR